MFQYIGIYTYGICSLDWRQQRLAIYWTLIPARMPDELPSLRAVVVQFLVEYSEELCEMLIQA